MTHSGSVSNRLKNLLPPGMMRAQICPLHSSNSKSPTFPKHLQSFRFMTDLHFNSENSMAVYPVSYILYSIVCGLGDGVTGTCGCGVLFFCAEMECIILPLSVNHFY